MNSKSQLETYQGFTCPFGDVSIWGVEPGKVGVTTVMISYSMVLIPYEVSIDRRCPWGSLWSQLNSSVMNPWLDPFLISLRNGSLLAPQSLVQQGWSWVLDAYFSKISIGTSVGSISPLEARLRKEVRVAPNDGMYLSVSFLDSSSLGVS